MKRISKMKNIGNMLLFGACSYFNVLKNLLSFILILTCISANSQELTERFGNFENCFYVISKFLRIGAIRHCGLDPQSPEI